MHKQIYSHECYSSALQIPGSTLLGGMLFSSTLLGCMFSSMILNETANFVKKARLVSTAHGGATNTKQLPKTTSGMLLNGTLLGKHTVQQDVAWWNVVQQQFAQ